MHRFTHGPIRALAIFAVVALAGACGGTTSSAPTTSSEPSTATSPEASAGTSAGTSAGAGSTIAVDLQEWAILPDPASGTAGPTTFDVTNTSSAEPHELVVIKTDLAAADLPTKEDGSVDESGEGVEVIGEVEELDPGATGSGTWDLAAGNYVLICNVVETESGTTTVHYTLGMRIEFVVG